MAADGPDIRQAFDEAYADRAPVFGTDEDGILADTAALLPGDAYVLDAGCGDGRNSLFLLEHGFRVKAVDFAPNGVRYLEEEATWRGLGDQLETEVADIRSLELDREEFDAIVSTTVIENLPKHEQVGVIHRLRLACRKGGFIAIEAHSDRDPAAVTDSNGDRMSEFGDTIIGPMRRNELLGYFSAWRVLHYHDVLFEDTSHGEPHVHGWTGIIAQRPEE